MADSYRRMRNTVRFLLGNLHGFDPAQHACPVDELRGARSLGAGAHARSCRRRSIEAYRDYEFHLIYQKVHNFCVVDLGGFYLDVHQGPPVHHAGRQPRAPLGADARCATSPRAMVRWLAPILSFTAEEIWRYLPGERARVGVPDDLARAAGGDAADAHRLAGAHCSCAPTSARELEKLRDSRRDRRAAGCRGRRVLRAG